MGFLAGKRILITGLLSNRSISYGVAKAMQREGAELPSPIRTIASKSVSPRWPPSSAALVFPCDVQHDEEITALFDKLGQHWDGLDGLVHSIAFAPGEALEGISSRRVP
jgi:enoyl-[acyl-carrier protein] reductase I